METSPTHLQTLQNIVAAIDSCIDKVASAQLSETAALLRIARLDLMVRIHGISERELEQLAFVASRDRRAANRGTFVGLRHVAPRISAAHRRMSRHYL